MSEEDEARAAGQMKWLLLVMLQRRHANWHELTNNEQRAPCCAIVASAA
jgi:hypothetical protein